MKTKSNNQLRIGGIVEKGFTLVELLIVVIILAILAAIVVPQFASTTGDARSAAADGTLAGLRAAIDLYYQQHNNTYPGALTAVPTAACTGTASRLYRYSRYRCSNRWCRGYRNGRTYGTAKPLY